MHKILTLCWFSPSRLEYVSVIEEGDSREQAGRGRFSMAESAEESRKQKLEDSRA